MTSNLLTTSVIGSYAWPAWLHTALAASQRGEYGPEDMRETQDDAVDLAVRDQEEAGVDIITDGEMRRVGFFTAEFYGHMTGLRELPARRKVGVASHDQRESYLAEATIEALHGLGLLEEWNYVRTRTQKSIKMTCPGPYTLAGRIQPGSTYKDRIEVSYRLAEIVNKDLCSLVDAGVTFIQLDEPSYAVHSLKNSPVEFVKLFNATVQGVKAKIGVHLC